MRVRVRVWVEAGWSTSGWSGGEMHTTVSRPRCLVGVRGLG